MGVKGPAALMRSSAATVCHLFLPEPSLLGSLKCSTSSGDLIPPRISRVEGLNVSYIPTTRAFPSSVLPAQASPKLWRNIPLALSVGSGQ